MDQGDGLRDSLERLVRLGLSPGLDMRPVLLRVLVDMFVRKPHHAPSDLLQFEDMIQRLLDDADTEVRQVVAERLAGHPEVPRGLLDRFMAEGDTIAAPVLRHAALDIDTLLGAAAWGTTAMALGIAERRPLEHCLVGSLADRPEPGVLLALARNSSASIDRDTFRYLARRARDDSDLGLALLARDSHAAERAPLFLLANSDGRAAIMLAVRRDDLGPDTFRPRLTPEETAALTRVERTVLSPDRDGFDTALAAALRIGVEDAWRLIDDPKGEPLALALAAIGASAELAARVFILSGPAIGHSVMAVRTLTALVEHMPRRAATRLVVAMTHAAPRAQSRAVPEPDGASRGHRHEDGRSVARPRERSDNLAPQARRIRGAQGAAHAAIRPRTPDRAS